MSILISIIAIGCYAIAGLLLTQRFSTRSNSAKINKTIPIGLGFIAVILHTVLLFQSFITIEGINFGFYNAVSLIFWLIALFFLLSVLTKPIDVLGIVILPFTALAIIAEQVFPTKHFLSSDHVSFLEVHILISIVAYSLLSLAAIQAILLAIQDRHLHNKHPGGFIRALPPLQTMETLMFQMIGLGFVLHSLALFSGAIFLEDMFAQHLAHKTILSVIAWMVFAILLIGRWRFGWRGKIAIRWTLAGFVTLLLAYLGSKLVLEIVLR